MGVLLDTASDLRFTLHGRTLVGRSPVCHMQLDDLRVSGEHAMLCWTSRWTVRDLGSSNGTFVDGKRLAPGDETPLTAGDRLSFGHEEGRWSLLDDAGPVGAAHELGTSRRVLAEGSLLCLPGNTDPEVSVYLDAHGQWVAERDATLTPTEDQSVVAVGDTLWRLFLPVAHVPTWQASGTDALQLCFRVSLDEEYVELDVMQAGRRLELGSSSSHYLLLVLARERMADHERGSTDPGWLLQDDLARMLGVHDTTIYTQIHRARARLAKHGIGNAGRIIERRPRTRQLRIGTSRLEVHRI